MENRFFDEPIINSPYEYPARHWELDAEGQPTQQIIPTAAAAPSSSRQSPSRASADGRASPNASSSWTKAPGCPPQSRSMTSPPP